MKRTLTIYNYDRDNYDLVGSSEAQPNPREKGKFLIPAFATDIEPPTFRKNETAVFDESSNDWSIVPDYRNTPVYSIENGEEYIIKELGPIPEGFTLKEKPEGYFKFDKEADKWVKDQEAIYEAKLHKLKSDFFEKMRETIEVDGVIFNTTPEMISFISLILATYDKSNFPGNTVIMDAEYNQVPVTYDDLIKISSAIIKRNQKIIKINSKKN
jgi:frataxin-like iron-binding protein CyaY